MHQFLRITTIALSLLAGVGIAIAQNSDVEAVGAANQSYYSALSARDLRAMERVWSQSADDVNVAPPVRPAAHTGWEEVKNTYQNFWATLDELSVSMDKPSIKVKGNVAWVYGIEQSKRRTKDGKVSGGPNFGTSIFIKQDDRWVMIFHQAALIPQVPPSEK